MKIIRILKWLAVLGMAFVLMAVLGPCIVDSVKNSSHLYRIVDSVDALPSPPGTRRLAGHSAVGLLVGNGNHCDFFAGVLMKSQQPPEAVLKHYRGKTVYNPVTGTNQDVEVSILTRTEDFERLWLPDFCNAARHWGLSSADFAGETLYLISFFGSYQANNDLRCF